MEVKIEMKELFNRLLHCLAEMYVIQNACSILPDDFLRRTIGRMLFIRLDDFVKTAPQLKNMLRKTGSDVNMLNQSIRQLTMDYENHYANIRDYLTAHRDDLDLQSRLNLWNDIDKNAIDILADDARNILAKIEMIKPSLGQYECPPEINDPTVNKVLSSFTTETRTVTVGMDNLAYSRHNTSSLIPHHESQRRGLQIVSCFDLVHRQLMLLKVLESSICPILKRTIKASIILDLVNLIEDLFGFKRQNPRNKPFVVMALESQFQGADILRKHAEGMDNKTINHLIELRNKACAHYDRKIPINEVVNMLDAVNLNYIITIYSSLQKVFTNACRADYRTIMYLIHNQPLKDVIEVAQTGLDKPFE